MPVEDLENGFINDDTPHNQERGAIIMDVLRICVPQPVKEVIAVGARFSHREKNLEIFVAGNSNHNNSLGKVRDHLENVLRKVQELGVFFAAERNKDGRRRKWKSYASESPEKVAYTDEHRITQCARELEAMIVSYSAAKLHKRIAKRWSTFRLFSLNLAGRVLVPRPYLSWRCAIWIERCRQAGGENTIAPRYLTDGRLCGGGIWYFGPQIWGNYESGS